MSIWTEIKHGAQHVDHVLDEADKILAAVVPVLAGTPLAPYAPAVGVVRTVLQAVELITPELEKATGEKVDSEAKLRSAVNALFPFLERMFGWAPDVAQVELLIERVLAALKASAEPAAA